MCLVGPGWLAAQDACQEKLQHGNIAEPRLEEGTRWCFAFIEIVDAEHEDVLQVPCGRPKNGQPPKPKNFFCVVLWRPPPKTQYLNLILKLRRNTDDNISKAFCCDGNVHPSVEDTENILMKRPSCFTCCI